MIEPHSAQEGASEVADEGPAAGACSRDKLEVATVIDPAIGSAFPVSREAPASVGS